MKVQVFDNDGILIGEQVVTVNDFDILFMKYDTFNGMEVTILKKDLEVKEEYIPKTIEYKGISEYMDGIAQKYVKEYMRKYEEADAVLAEYKVNKSNSI